MVYAVRSAEYAPGKREEALEFLRKAVSHFKKLGSDVEILQNRTPNPGQQCRFWTMHKHASWVEMAEVDQKISEDSEWRALVSAAHGPGGCMVHNTFTRNNFEVL